MLRRKELAWPVLEEESYRHLIRPQETQQQGENTFILLIRIYFLKDSSEHRILAARICTHMHVCMHACLQITIPKRSKRTDTLKTIKLLAQLQGRGKSK